MAKSNVARGASMAASVWGKLDDAIKAKGGTENALHLLDLKEGKELLNGIANMIVWEELKTRDRFPVTIDYSKTLDEMIAECGCGYNGSNITVDNFPITGQGVVEEEIILVHFNNPRISNDDVVIELNKMGLEPAGLVHALAFGKMYPNIQRLLSISFLGSSCVVGKERNFPCLGGSNSGRGLDLDCIGIGGGDRCRFAAVRKSSPDRFLVRIDYGKSLREMAAECGLDHINSSLLVDEFWPPNKGTGVVEEEIVIVPFFCNEYVSRENVITKLAEMGLTPARIDHALALVKKYPNVQRGCKILFLGSMLGDQTAPLLYRGKELMLAPTIFGWHDNSYRFAAVRKSAPDRFPVTIDYSKPLDEMIAECGCDHNDPNIRTTNLSVIGQGVVKEEIILVHFERIVGRDTVITELAKMGLEPAHIGHALAFGKNYPNVQKQFPIVFLDYPCRIGEENYVSCLDCSGSRRHLRLRRSGSNWHDHCRFAAVRAKKS